MNYAFLIAGGVSAFGFVITLILGRRPRKDSTASNLVLLADARFARFASLVLLAAMTLVYADASRRASGEDAAFLVSALALLFALARLVLAVQARARRLDIGEWGFHALAAGLGLAGADLQSWLPG